MDKKKSKTWLEDHEYYTDGYHGTKDKHRWRQYDPQQEKFNYRNDDRGDGITAVVGVPKKQKSEAKMTKLVRVLGALYCEPWLIQPQMHETLCQIAWAHVDGSAHDLNGIAVQFKNAKQADAEAPQDNTTMFGRVAVLDVEGVIGRRFSSCLNSSGVVSIDVLERLVTEAATDNAVDAVVLNIDSPGGTVTGVPEAAEAIAQLTAAKPVVAYTGGMMASAAYWISAPADAIFASSSANVGSIGVYTALLDVTRAMEMAGYKTELFKAGKYKAMGLRGVSLTEEQRQYIQKEVDEIADEFKAHVLQNRAAIPAEAMEGQTFMGRNALEVGLVDEIGSINDAIAFAEQAAKEWK
jgi:signal peptide peptidase SppA